MKKAKVLGFIATLITLIAMVCSSSASLFFMYQPKAPRSLK
jgi:cyclic lactone autoinducer peptide